MTRTVFHLNIEDLPIKKGIEFMKFLQNNKDTKPTVEILYEWNCFKAKRPSEFVYFTTRWMPVE